MKNLKFQVTMKVGYMYDFLMQHAYRGWKGVIGIAISIGAFCLYITGFGKGDTTQNVLLILMATLFTIIDPVRLFYKAFKQVKMNPSFQAPLEYLVSEKGITVGQGEEHGTFPWSEISRVVETRTSVIVYLSYAGGYIFPKKCLADQMDSFKQILRDHVDPKNCRLK